MKKQLPLNVHHNLVRLNGFYMQYLQAPGTISSENPLLNYYLIFTELLNNYLIKFNFQKLILLLNFSLLNHYLINYRIC